MPNQTISLDKLYLIQNKCNEWINNYQQFQLRNNSRFKNQHHQILSLKRSTEKAIYQFNNEKINIEDIGSIPVSKNILDQRKKERSLLKDKFNQVREEKLQLKKALQFNINEEQLNSILEDWGNLSKKYITLGFETLLDINQSIDNIILVPVREFIIEANYFLTLTSEIENEELIRYDERKT
jgi:hypothetical protein